MSADGRGGMPRPAFSAESGPIRVGISRATGASMTKWLLAAAALSVGLVPLCGCTGKNDSEPCQIGSLGCYCYANDTCDDDLQCVPMYQVCRMSNAGFGGAPSLPEGGEGGHPEIGAGGDGSPSGAPSTGGGGASGNQGGGVNLAGSPTAGGGAGGAGGSGGSATNPFPDSAVGCALVTSCPSCCETVGVYALDTLANDATLAYVTEFDVTAASATAEYDLATSEEIGAIFFRFKSAQDIGSLAIVGTGTGGSLEVALVRANGLDGCIYPIVDGSLSPVPDSCWGLGAGPYAALPADQIEVRVRSTLGGRAALSVTGVQYAP